MPLVKKSVVVVALLAGCLTAASLATPAADDKAKDAIRAHTASWFKAYNAGDVDAVVTLYAEDAIIMPPGAPVARGRVAIREYLAKDIAGAQAAGATIAAGKWHDVGVSGDLGWDCGDYVVRDKSGAVLDSGSFLAIFRKAGDKWVYVRDTWNSDRPPAPAATAK
jgi:ketosteroid isomerase-like protein